MGENFDSSRPIYAQLVERLQARIASGDYPPGSRLDSVRDLANAAGVNPNTMQRALAELERQGLVRTERTAGRFVTDDEARIGGVKMELAKQQVAAFVGKMKSLGYTPAQLAELILQAERTEDENNE